MARLIAGTSSATAVSKMAANSSGVSPSAKADGSNVGHDAMASTAPSLGRMTTADPATDSRLRPSLRTMLRLDRMPLSRVSSTAAWRSRSMLVTRLSPGVGGIVLSTSSTVPRALTARRFVPSIPCRSNS